MINRRLHSTGKWIALSGALFTTIILSGCEGGNETSSTIAPAPTPAPVAAPVQQPAPPAHFEVMPQLPQIDMVKAALLNDPENHQLLVALGDAYFEAKRYQEAIPVYEKAIKINNKDVDTLNDLALAHFYTRDSDAALNTLAMATSSAPDYKFAWLSTGFILLSLERYDEAVLPLEKARELDPAGAVGMEADSFLKKIEQIKAGAGAKN